MPTEVNDLNGQKVRLGVEDTKPMVTSQLVPQADVEPSPVTQWVQNDRRINLWSSQLPDAGAFTDIPAGSYLRVQGPEQSGRIPVYYVGDGLLRKPGGAWVDAASVRGIDSPPPGAVPQIDSYASRERPDWVQAHRATVLWSGPDGNAEALTDLPQWSYLKVDGLERGSRLLVWYAGDFVSRQPGIGWVDDAAVGPAGEPGSWFKSQKATPLWSGPDDKAQRFADVPRDVQVRLAPGGQPSGGRLLVEVFPGVAGTQPGVAWVGKADLKEVPPPSPMPSSRPTPVPDPRAPQPSAFGTVDGFIQAVGEAARRSQTKTGVPASVTVAQAILESDWGRSGLSRRAYNLFGIKALSGPGPAGAIVMSTWEHLAGNDTVVKDAFRAYHSFEESVDDHGHFFVRNARYKQALTFAGDPDAFAQEIQRAGYATDPSYASKLITLMQRYDLYRFDAS